MYLPSSNLNQKVFILFPSYIMTGGNILIEKTKCSMISDDIKYMMKLI